MAEEIKQTEAATEDVATTTERKVMRKETFSLTKNDLFLLQSLSNQIELADHHRQLAQANVNNLLGVWSIERWSFPENVDVRFSAFDMEKGVITVEELEPLNDPKETAGETQPSNESDDAGSPKQPSPETESGSDEAEGTEQEVPTTPEA